MINMTSPGTAPTPRRSGIPTSPAVVGTWLWDAPAIRRVLCLAAFAGVLSGCATTAQDSTCGLDDATRQRASALMQAMVQRGHAPGVVVDLRCHGQPWLATAAGVATGAPSTTGTTATAAGQQRPMKQDDLFRIYSMTKPVTAVAALLLVDEGRLSIDDPVAKHLPEFSVATVFAEEKEGKLLTKPLERPLTVRDLMRHTAGMPYLAPVPHPVYKRYMERGIDNGSGEIHKPADGSAPIDSAAELTRRIASIPLLHQPGARHTYGSASDVLGRVVEVVSGQRLGDFMAARLFTPLGMNDTSFRVAPDTAARLTTAYAAPAQRPQGDGGVLNTQRTADLPPSKLSPVDAAESSAFSRPRPMDFGGAGLVSTAADYHRFMGLLAGTGPRLLSPASLAEASRNQLGEQALAQSSLAPQGLGYGLSLGVVMDPQKAPAPATRGTVFWGGAASTYFWVDRARGISGVVMTQVFGGDVSPYFVELLNVIYPKPSTSTTSSR
ncbi:MAG TPA: serine hydrolase domain-containing protein [Rubrivivax sp.]|nr:serine hydrolase domain-containing protein [Rubrivivax sp.]